MCQQITFQRQVEQEIISVKQPSNSCINKQKRIFLHSSISNGQAETRDQNQSKLRIEEQVAGNPERAEQHERFYQSIVESPRKFVMHPLKGHQSLSNVYEGATRNLENAESLELSHLTQMQTNEFPI